MVRRTGPKPLKRPTLDPETVMWIGILAVIADPQGRQS